MAEELILTDPIVTPDTTKYRVSAFTMDLETVYAVTGDPGIVTIKLKDDTGKYSSYQYTGQTAITMIKQLNTANLSTKSLQKRILEKLSADGFLPGTVQGTPDAVTE
jgi:hypothetical protein